MTPTCSSSYLYHRWNFRGLCDRCGISGGVRGMPTSERWAGDLFETGVRGPSRLVDHHLQSDSPPALALVDSASSSLACAPVSSAVFLDLQAFLHRHRHHPLVVVP